MNNIETDPVDLYSDYIDGYADFLKHNLDAKRLQTDEWYSKGAQIADEFMTYIRASGISELVFPINHTIH